MNYRQEPLVEPKIIELSDSPREGVRVVCRSADGPVMDVDARELVAAVTSYRAGRQVLTDEVIKELLTNAIGGGSSYWAKEINSIHITPREDLSVRCIKYGFYVIDAETGVRTDVAPEDIKAATYLLRDFKYSSGKPAPYYADAVNGNDDDETGDVFLQLCVFKELVYG